MTWEDKDLLFKELSTRHPYGVKLQVRLDYGDNSHKEGIYDAEIDAITSYNIEVTYYDTNMGGKARDWTFMYEEVKPYLRPMSSMTREELHEVQEILGKGVEIREDFILSVDSSINSFTYLELIAVFNWLNAHHFDYIGLLKKGLAIEAPKEMYN